MLRPMATRHIFFIRHGESVHHVTGMTGGWTDTSLTDAGARQIKGTAGALQRLASGWPIITSDLQRTAQSAAIIGRAIGSEPVAEPMLHEINNGVATGLTQAEADAIARPAPAEFDPDWAACDDAESYAALSTRMAMALDALGHEWLIVVGHGVSGTILLQTWLGLDPLLPLSLRLGPASLSELRVTEWNERQLVRLNVIDGPAEGH